MTQPATTPHGIGGLFYGYGGLDLAVAAALGLPLTWLAEYDGLPTPRKPRLTGAAAIAAHHHPDVPNLGDVTTVAWDTLPRPLVITGGSPCQDLSGAGRRAGMTTGTRSNLWVAMREAIAVLRPPLVVWENVRGAYSASADSAVVYGGRLLGPRDGGPALRALGRVLGDLSDLGYDTVWHGLRAADIGAPHGRLRVFVVALDRTQAHLVPALRPASRPAAGQPAVAVLPTPAARDSKGAWEHTPGHAPDLGTAVSLLPTPRVGVQGNNEAETRRNSPNLETTVAALLPTPAVNDMGDGKTPAAWDEWTAKMQAKHGNGNGHGASLAIEAQRLLPTPMAQPSGNSPEEHLRKKPGRAIVSDLAIVVEHDLLASGGRLLQTPSTAGAARNDELLLPGEAAAMEGRRWGLYAAAVARWEALTRPAPDPTMLSTTGTAQLAPAFVEWMMGLPAGHVTAVPGISRTDQLRALGNGVVPQQAEAALRYALPILLST